MRSEDGFRNLYKMQGFIVVTCSFSGEFESKTIWVYIIDLRFITNIINYDTGSAETKKCPQDLTFTTEIVRISFLVLQKSEEKIGKFSQRSFNITGVQSKSLGGEGVVDGEGGSSERCLKWGGGGGGSLRDLSKNILK